MTPPLQLRCDDFAHHEDLLVDLFPQDAFGFHDWDDLEEPCDCAHEEYEQPLPVDDERDSYCRATVWVDGGADFNLVVCCSCANRSEANESLLAEAARRVANAMRALDKAQVNKREAA